MKTPSSAHHTQKGQEPLEASITMKSYPLLEGGQACLPQPQGRGQGSSLQDKQTGPRLAYLTQYDADRNFS